jgi:hypothetical protein
MAAPDAPEHELAKIILAFEKEYRDSIKQSRIAPGDPLEPVLHAIAKTPWVLCKVMLEVGSQVIARLDGKAEEDKKKIFEFMASVSGASRSYLEGSKGTIDKLNAEVSRIEQAGNKALDSLRLAVKSFKRRLLVAVVALAWLLSLVGCAVVAHQAGSERRAEEKQLVQLILGPKEDQQILVTFLKGSRNNRVRLALLAEEDENVVALVSAVGRRAKEAIPRDNSVWPGCIANGPPVQTSTGATVSTCLVEVSAESPAPGPPVFLQRTFHRQGR